MPFYLKPESIEECDSFISGYETRIDGYITKCNSLDEAPVITVEDLPTAIINSRTRPFHRIQLGKLESLQEQRDYVHLTNEYLIGALKTEIEMCNEVKQKLASQAA
jgi:hypothetical protein